MFGAPTYKWLPAKATLHASFLMFYTKTPEVFDSVADVTLENGRIATQSFPTTNGIPASGGSFSSTGPTIVDGMLYVNSGYGGQGMAGNVLLAFSAY